MKVKNQGIVDLANALTGLETKDRVFKFTATTRYTLSKNLRKLNEMTQDFEATRQAMFQQHNLNVDKQGQVNIHAFNEDWNKLMQEESEVTLAQVKLESLNLDKNDIPIFILAGMALVIADEENRQEE